ncbi:MAG: ribosome-associated translation inhibitor RaiA [Oscillospiraceae bacterium]
MTINFKARKTIIKDSFKEKTEKRLSKFDRFFASDVVAVVTVTHEQERETVEITIKSNGMIYRAERTTDDRSISLEAVCDVLMKHIVKNKAKLDNKVRANAFAEIEEECSLPEEELKIVKIKKFPAKPMTPEEAVLRMNLVDHQFFIFTNANTGEVSLVYHRNDGNYGLIEPTDSDE